RGFVLRIEVEHHGPSAEQIPQLHWLTRLVRQREIRRAIADAYFLVFRHRHSPLTSYNVASWRHTTGQCAAAPAPGIPLLLCIRSRSGSDNTKHAPNNRKSCSNESIIACRVTWPFSTISAFDSASGAGVPVTMSLAMMPASRSRVTSLNWVTFAIRSARWMAVNRCTYVAGSEII